MDGGSGGGGGAECRWSGEEEGEGDLPSSCPVRPHSGDEAREDSGDEGSPPPVSSKDALSVSDIESSSCYTNVYINIYLSTFLARHTEEMLLG